MPPEKSASISKNEIDTILQVNKNAIELQTQTSNQYEEIISELDDNKANTEINTKMLDKVKEDVSEVKKSTQEIKESIFKLNVLVASGLFSLILNIIQFLLTLKK